MPDAFELPRMLRAVIPHVSRQRFAGFRRGIVNEFVALAFGHAVGSGRRLARRCPWLYPGLAAVVGALNDLSEPGARLRRIQPVRINRRTLDVINFPARKMRSVDFPSFPLAVRCQDERALPCSNQ